MAAPSLASPLRAIPPIAATDVIERIKKNIGVEWKAGDGRYHQGRRSRDRRHGRRHDRDGVMSVLRQAVDAGANLVITSEPTFYGRADAPNAAAGRGGGAGRPATPTHRRHRIRCYAAKNAFIEKHGLVVFRLSEHWRLRRPDPFATGLASALGWSKRTEARRRCARGMRFPPRRSSALAAELKKKLGSRGGIRVIGDPQTRVRTVALLPGSTPLAAALDNASGR